MNEYNTIKKGVERPFYQGKLNIGQDELSDSVF